MDFKEQYANISNKIYDIRNKFDRDIYRIQEHQCQQNIFYNRLHGEIEIHPTKVLLHQLINGLIFEDACFV
jgi:hypothetical protein